MLGCDLDRKDLRQYVKHTIGGVIVGGDVRAEAPLWLSHGPANASGEN
jgi:hypothetical protein